jgi:hypothetical protein
MKNSSNTSFVAGLDVNVEEIKHVFMSSVRVLAIVWGVLVIVLSALVIVMCFGNMCGVFW